MNWILPHPLLFLTLLALWLLLNQTISAGSIVLGSLVGTVCCWAAAALRLERPRIRHPGTIVRLASIVLIDVIRSNIVVAQILLRLRKPEGAAGFLTIPLDMRSRHGISVLACIITSTPGTIWVSYDASRGTLLLHVLDLVDPSAWVRIIKDRYERLLMEIFE